MKNNVFRLLLFFVFQACVCNINSQLYWHESFNSYEVGKTLQSEKTWLYQDVLTNTIQIVQNIHPLTKDNLVTDKNYFIGGCAYKSVGVSVPVVQGTDYYKAYNADGQSGVVGYKLNGSNELWYSMLVRADGNGVFAVSFHDSPFFWSVTDVMTVKRSEMGEWGILINGVDMPAKTPSDEIVSSCMGEAMLVVCKLNFESDGTRLSLFMNPTLGVTPTTPNVTGKTTAPARFKALGLKLSNEAYSCSIDELRVGATYADVTPQQITSVRPIKADNAKDINVFVRNGRIVADLSKLNGSTMITICDMKGSVLKTMKTTDRGMITVDFSCRGLYLVRVQNSDTLSAFKVVL